VQTVTSADGTRLHVEVFGRDDAPSIVLVHGWTNSIALWHWQIRDLQDEFRIVAYDQRGHGRSESPRQHAYSDTGLAEDLHAVLAATVPEESRCVVAGHSMGGMTIVAWAGRYAGEVHARVAAAALISTGMGDLLAHLAVLRPRRGAAVYNAIAPRLVGVRAPLPRSSTPLTHRALRHIALSPKASPAAVAFTERMVLASPTASRAGFGRFFQSLDLSTAVPRLDVPTLVMVGEVDRLTPPWHARKLAAELPQLEALEEFPEVGHQLPLEAHAAVSERLRALARRHLSAAGGAAETAGAADGAEAAATPPRRVSRRGAAPPAGRPG
jgi:pimeloyl-ACP methyl ester carboxylesterase